MQLPFGISAEVVELLREAASEIARLDGPENEVCRRLKALQQRIVPLSTSIGELAVKVDASPRDILDAALAAGVRCFWHEGQAVRAGDDLQAFLRQRSHWDPVPELEVDLTMGMAQRLAEQLGILRDELFLGSQAEASPSAARGPRKFVASKSRLPGASQTGNYHERTG
jgi:acetylornithine/succinyldiaminopimelate/putrescine aminotransferase